MSKTVVKSIQQKFAFFPHGYKKKKKEVVLIPHPPLPPWAEIGNFMKNMYVKFQVIWIYILHIYISHELSKIFCFNDFVKKYVKFKRRSVRLQGWSDRNGPKTPDPSFPGAPFFRISWNTMCSENIIKEVRSQVELGLGWSWTVRLFWKTLSVVLEELLLWILMSFDIFFSSRLSIFNRNRVNFCSACIFKVWCP